MWPGSVTASIDATSSGSGGISSDRATGNWMHVFSAIRLCPLSVAVYRLHTAGLIRLPAVTDLGVGMTRDPVELEEHWDAGAEPLLIRPIRPDDAAQHDAFFHRLSAEDIRFRFFAAVRELSPAQLVRFTRLDYERDMALIAVRETTRETVGVARLSREADPRVAEFAVIVERVLQGKGLATHLLQRLLNWAPRHGVREVVGEILADNAQMLELARNLGFRLSHRPEDPEVVEARICLDAPA